MTGLLQITDPGRKTRTTRLAFNPPVVCPAGAPVYETEKGSGVRCAVERNTLTAVGDPQSMTGFCCSRDYVICPSWEREKEWVAEGFRAHVTEDRRGMLDQSRYRPDLVEQTREVEVTHYYPED